MAKNTENAKNTEDRYEVLSPEWIEVKEAMRAAFASDDVETYSELCSTIRKASDDLAALRRFGDKITQDLAVRFGKDEFAKLDRLNPARGRAAAAEMSLEDMLNSL